MVVLCVCVCVCVCVRLCVYLVWNFTSRLLYAYFLPIYSTVILVCLYRGCNGYQAFMCSVSYELNPKKQLSIDCFLYEVRAEAEETVEY